MLPSSLLLTVILYLSTPLCSSLEIQFTSQLELSHDGGVQNQDELLASISFTPSQAYALHPTSSNIHIQSRPTTVYRPRSLDILHRARLRSLQNAESLVEQPIWDAVEVEGPDVEHLHTLAQLARMTGNAYSLPGEKSWYDVDQAWNRSFPYGWEESDGFRGHVFMSSDNSTIILSIKGTTVQGPTSKLDKFNDNLLFSCCCARVDVSWVFRTVCDCYANKFRCDNQCLTDALIQDSLFYSVGVKLVDDLLQIYPRSNVWLVGHSLGGSLASLLGATYGLPAVAFEAPGERLAAKRLHLPLPPPPADVPLHRVLSRPRSASSFLRLTSKSRFNFRLPHLKFPWPPAQEPSTSPADLPSDPGPPSKPPTHSPVATTHVYHTADPIPQGTCTGFNSPCAQAGYALETRCHLGQSIIFDTVSEMGWTADVRKHTIKTVVKEVLEGDVWWGRVPRGEDTDESEEGRLIRRGLGKKKGKDGEKPPRQGVGNVPKPVIEEDCVDCFKWEFGDFKDK